ncbi:ABC transporter ATP-binding protein [Arcanobacterium hippocoleae]
MSSFSNVLTPVNNPVVKIDNLVKVFGTGENEVRAVDGVSADIERGKLTAVMGPSGSGKSTLMHCVVGLETATSGSVLLDGKEVTAMKERQLTALRRDDIGFIFQSFNLVPNLNARENIELPAVIAGRKLDQDFLTA